MNPRAILATVLALALAAIIAIVVKLNLPTPQPQAHAPPPQTPELAQDDLDREAGKGAPQPRQSNPAPAAPKAARNVEPWTLPPRIMPPAQIPGDSGRGVPGNPAAPPSPTPPQADPEEGTPVIPIEVARVALGFVGADPEADEVWVQAINDPNLTPKERQDLIEDLNEEGFADPRNITEDDLPLILSRMALIEELADDAMDEVNAAAFAEAYKDLSNMLARLRGRC